MGGMIDGLKMGGTIMDRIGLLHCRLSKWKKTSGSNSCERIKRLREEFESEVSSIQPDF